ncbi:MAG: hypothetical protein GEV12_01460 [Micromonosporaceae bacterium]|nr:hypothetical protein [Micromonosporaceae bacterium]
MTVVGAYCGSHGAIMMTREADAPRRQRDSIYSAFARVGAEIAALEPDAVLIIGTDHGRIYTWDLVPSFVLGVGDQAQGIGEAGTPEVTWPMHGDVARAVLTGALTQNIDMSYSEVMRIDHSFVTPMLLMGLDKSIPIVPLMSNCNAPPIPSPVRYLRIGQVIGETLEALPQRVVLIGTGGLSHWVGDPARREFLRRPAGTRWRDADKHAMVLPDTGPINGEFDNELLSALRDGRAAQFAADWPEERIEAEAGNGAQEIRNWLLVAAAVPRWRAQVLSYEQVGQWLTGSAIVSFT